MRVPPRGAEEARAQMLELFPNGFAEVARSDGLELVVYTDEAGEERARAVFPHLVAVPFSQGWEEEWKRFHRPVRVGPLWIGPPWRTPAADATAVVIDPGRAFGTGSHGTTRLCLRFLLALERGSLLDAGCGSGVLAIAGAKLGFTPVTALDNDPQAVEAAERNAAANGVSLDIRLADALVEELPRANVVVANIALDAVQRLAPGLSCERLVTSGYLRSQSPELPGFRHLARRRAREWAADLFARE